MFLKNLMLFYWGQNRIFEKKGGGDKIEFRCKIYTPELHGY